jgi:hypothetical protein
MRKGEIKMENMNPIYRVCYLYNTTPEKAMEKIFTMAKGCWGETWTEEAIEEWIEDFKDEPYDEFNGTRIEIDEIDMDMSLEGC